MTKAPSLLQRYTSSPESFIKFLLTHNKPRLPRLLGRPLQQIGGTQAGAHESQFDTQLVRSTKTPWSLELRSTGQRAVLETKYPTCAACHCVCFNIELNWAGGHLQVSLLQSCLLLERGPTYTSWKPQKVLCYLVR